MRRQNRNVFNEADMEYERTKDGQIQADFAERVGQIVIQYGQLSEQLPQDQRYEITLWLCLLQSLLTTCSESIKKNRYLNMQALRDLSSMRLAKDPIRLGLDAECIDYYSGEFASITYSGLLGCLRDALSHPNNQDDSNLALPVTGYTTSNAASGNIEQIIFVWSPWVCERKRQLKDIFRPHSGAENRRRLDRECRNLKVKLGINDLEIREAPGGYLEVMREGHAFRPEIRVRLTTTQIRTLTLELSQLLAEPLEKVTHPNQANSLQRVTT